MFRHLRTKLTILYAGLFAIALLLVAIAVAVAVTSNAEHAIRNDMAASGTVFDRLRAARSQQLHDSADLLSRDFGFRAAVATHDQATVSSALENLRQRLGIDLAMLVDVDGKFTGLDSAKLEGGGAALWNTLSNNDNASGVVMIGGRPYWAISTPVMSPTLTGWVVFATKLDRKELSGLEALSAIPLNAVVLTRTPLTHWAANEGISSEPERGMIGQFIDRALSAGHAAPSALNTSSGAAIALVKPLQIMGGDARAVLLLRYPMAKALAPYVPLFVTLLAVGILGLALMVIGSWSLARNLTRPISALDDAAHRLQRGEMVTVEVATQDEIGRLAHSFNIMSAEIAERERKITHLALHDGETGLPNRLAIERHIQALESQRAPGVVVVAALGVDRFEYVRGAIGHDLAGALARQIGGRLNRVRSGLSAARISTGVLGVALNVGDMDEARALAGELLAALEAPLVLNGNTVDVSLSVGLAGRGQIGAALTSPIERACIALDQARLARQKIAVFDEVAYGDPASNLSLISELLAAMSQGDLALHYQPKYDFRRQCITGVEALARWRHPTRGPVPPDLFVGMVEETGHIRTMTDYVLAKAIVDQSALRAAGHDLTVSVNISGRLMSDLDFADRAVAKVTSAGARLCFEVTETAVIENPELALKVIDRLSAAGISVSIDDYGSGLSSLAYLKQIRADELKIDKAFVLSLSEGQRDALLVKSTIDLAHSLGLKVVAEGVETAAALALLSGMGCDMAQGYFIARPLALPDLIEFMNRDQTTQVAVA